MESITTRRLLKYPAPRSQGQYAALLRSEGVMFFRPRAQAAFGISQLEQVPFDLAGRLAGQQDAAGSPTVAVFDGAPLVGHTALIGRVDPDGFGGSYQARQMQHGIAMASTVIHGDLHDSGRALRAPIYVRPILQPDTSSDALR